MFTPPAGSWSNPVRRYGHRASFSPRRGFAPGGSGWTVATASGVTDTEGAAVTVRSIVRVDVEVDGAGGVADDVHPASKTPTPSTTATTTATTPDALRLLTARCTGRLTCSEQSKSRG